MNEAIKVLVAPVEETSHPFLAGGGEMGALMRAHNWAATPLGSPDLWPQSLRSAVSICLGSAFPIAIYWGSELALLYNDAWSPIPGEKHPWALGRPGREVWPEIWDDIGPLYEQVQATGEGIWQQDQLLPMRRHGYTEECYFNFTFSPIRGESARVEGIFNAVVETTFRVVGERRTRVLQELAERTMGARSAEEACSLAAETLRSASADLPFCLLYLRSPAEAGGRLARLAAAVGLPPGESNARILADLEDPSSIWPFAEIIETGQPALVNDLAERGVALIPQFWPELSQDALVVPFVPTGLAISGEPVGFLVAGVSPRRALDAEYISFIERVAAHVATAVSNARAYEEERRRAEALAEIDRAKTLFFSNVSHEFRTPLTLMLGPIEDALNDASASALNDVQRNRLDVAHRNSMRLLRLVNTLLDFSRIEAGRTQASFEPTDLASFTVDLASSFHSVTEKAGLTLKIDCRPLSGPVYVDRDMWEKIVLNLVSNAFKFTFQGKIAVELAATTDGGAVQLVVRDTGVGIPAAELSRMFERFHRIENQKSRSFEGSGIGLALVQELVKLHNGSIRVESEIGNGSAFIVTIPRRPAHLPAECEDVGDKDTTALLAPAFVEEASRWLPEGVTAPVSQSVDILPSDARGAGPATAERPRVLVADDNTDMREYLQRLLGARFEVETFSDGQAALAAAQANPPDLILSDVMMPQLDGFGLVKAIRADANLRALPVILLSARAGEEAKVEGLDAGVDDYLVKPFSARELVARIQANLQMAQIRKTAEEVLRKRTVELETVLATIPTAVWFTHDTDAKSVFGNRYASDLLRISAGANASLSAPIHERPTFRAFREGKEMTADELPIHRAARGEDVPEEELEIRFEDGTATKMLVRASPLLDSAGEPQGAVCAAIDITERLRAEAQRTILINELNHRVKNTLATVQSLAMQTFRNSKRSADGRLLFEARLAALSRAHDMLTNESWEGAGLTDTVNRALEPFLTDKRRIGVEGADVRISPKQALALSMALHELATNAAKYGSLSNTTGRVRIAWTIALRDGTGELKLTWTEEGGPPVVPPTRRGFGSRLIERALAHDLGGGASIVYRPGGVFSVINTPLEPQGTS